MQEVKYQTMGAHANVKGSRPTIVRKIVAQNLPLAGGLWTTPHRDA